jgi:hypothetical protein
MLALETEKMKEERLKREEERKQQMLEKLEHMKEEKVKKREEEEQKLMEYKQQVRKLKAQKYQHEKIQETYEKEVMLPELKREETIKNQIKSLHRPI